MALITALPTNNSPSLNDYLITDDGTTTSKTQVRGLPYPVVARFSHSGNTNPIALTVTSSSAHLIVTVGAAGALSSIFTVYCSSTGSVVKHDIEIGSSITVTTGTNTLTITPSNSSQMYIEDFVIYGAAMTA